MNHQLGTVVFCTDSSVTLVGRWKGTSSNGPQPHARCCYSIPSAELAQAPALSVTKGSFKAPWQGSSYNLFCCCPSCATDCYRQFPNKEGETSIPRLPSTPSNNCLWPRLSESYYQSKTEILTVFLVPDAAQNFLECLQS